MTAVAVFIRADGVNGQAPPRHPRPERRHRHISGQGSALMIPGGGSSSTTRRANARRSRACWRASWARFRRSASASSRQDSAAAVMPAESCFDFSLGPVASPHAPVSDFDLSFGVGSHGVPFGRGIPIGRDRLSDLIAIGLRHRRFGQQQCNNNGNEDSGHREPLHNIMRPTARRA